MIKLNYNKKDCYSNTFTYCFTNPVTLAQNILDLYDKNEADTYNYIALWANEKLCVILMIYIYPNGLELSYLWEWASKPQKNISYLNEKIYFYQNILRYILYHIKCDYDLSYQAIIYIYKCYTNYTTILLWRWQCR